MTDLDVKIENQYICLLIKCPVKMKRNWDTFRNMMRGWGGGVGTVLDLRKASKNFIPLDITAGCCDSKLEVRRKKDFPSHNKKCKCGKMYLIKWEIYDRTKTT